MKDLIIQALNEAILKLEKQTPQTKNKTIEINIEDVNPLDLSEFIKDNNIPNNAYFGVIDFSDHSNGCACLCYDVKIPITDKDKLIFNRRVFTTTAHRIVYYLLLANGYENVGFNSALFKEFNDTTVYDMFINNDIDRLVKYYSLSFHKIV